MTRFSTVPLLMVPLIGRALRADARRAAMVVGGVTLGVLLVLLLLGAYRNLTAGVAAYLGGEGLDAWILPSGADNLVRSSGVVPLAWRDTALAVPGVAAADPILRSFVSAASPAPNVTSTPFTQLALAYRSPDGLGGPPAVIAGERDIRGGGVLIDRATAFRLDVGIGDSILVNGAPAPVRGITRGTNLVATQLLFADFEHSAALPGASGLASLIVVRLATSADPAATLTLLRARLPGAQVIGREQFVSNNTRELSSGFLPLLTVLTALGVAVCALLIALLVQGIVDERRDQVAILMALGSPLGSIVAGVLGSGLLLVLVGAALGVAAARLTLQLFEVAYPVIELSLRWDDAALACLVFLVAAAVAAALPVVRLRTIDPVEAFRP